MGGKISNCRRCTSAMSEDLTRSTRRTVGSGRWTDELGEIDDTLSDCNNDVSSRRRFPSLTRRRHRKDRKRRSRSCRDLRRTNSIMPQHHNYDSDEKISNDQESIPPFSFGFQISTFDEGKTCICKIDKDHAVGEDVSLLFGEVKPHGVSVMLDERHLNAPNSTCILDLGMGCGKLALQAFIQFPNIEKVVGWEISPSRYMLAIENLRRYAQSLPQTAIVDEGQTYFSVVVIDDEEEIKSRRREIVFHSGNLFNCAEVTTADIVLLQVQIPVTSYRKLCEFLLKTRPGAKICSYKSLAKMFSSVDMGLPFSQLAVNKRNGDTFAATWGQARLLMYRREEMRGEEEQMIVSECGDAKIQSKDLL